MHALEARTLQSFREITIGEVIDDRERDLAGRHLILEDIVHRL